MDAGRGIGGGPAMPGPDRPSEAVPGLSLRPWQGEALDAWHAEGRVGVLEAVTGTGKTRVGVAAVGEALAAGMRAVVLVPSKVLSQQWVDSIHELLPGVTVGTRIGGRRPWQVLVSTVQSAYRHRALRPGERGLVVADECHRYGAERYSKALRPEYEWRLGLTATLARGDAGDRILRDYFGPVCFTMGYQRAADDHLIAPFRIAFAAVPLSWSERQDYDEVEDRLLRARRKLVRDFDLPAEPFGEFMKQVSLLSEGRDPSASSRAARSYMASFSERRRLLAGTHMKMRTLEGIAPAVRESAGAIIFTQTKESSQEAADLLASAGCRSAAMHSSLKDEEREERLELLRDGRVDAVSAPRMLDEGVDVPDADLGVVMASSRSRRQMIQRLGRVLRLREGKTARFVVLYAKDTVEDPFFSPSLPDDRQTTRQDFYEESGAAASKVGRFDLGAADGLPRLLAFLDVNPEEGVAVQERIIEEARPDTWRPLPQGPSAHERSSLPEISRSLARTATGSSVGVPARGGAAGHGSTVGGGGVLGRKGTPAGRDAPTCRDASPGRGSSIRDGASSLGAAPGRGANSASGATPDRGGAVHGGASGRGWPRPGDGSDLSRRERQSMGDVVLRRLSQEDPQAARILRRLSSRKMGEPESPEAVGRHFGIPAEHVLLIQEEAIRRCRELAAELVAESSGRTSSEPPITETPAVAQPTAEVPGPTPPAPHPVPRPVPRPAPPPVPASPAGRAGISPGGRRAGRVPRVDRRTRRRGPVRVSPADRDALGDYMRAVGRHELLGAGDESRLADLIEAGLYAQHLLDVADGRFDERELRRIAEQGRAAHEHFILANLRLVVFHARNYRCQGMEPIDLVQEGNIGLMRAVDGFDSRRGNKFSTYATWWIKQSIGRGLDGQDRLIRLPTHQAERFRAVNRARKDERLGWDEFLAAHRDGLPDLELTATDLAILTRSVRPVLDLDLLAEDELIIDALTCGQPPPSEDEILESLGQQGDLDAILGALEATDPRAVRILRFRYGLATGEPETLDAIGAHFGLTAERIRQIEKQALKQCREIAGRIANEPAAETGLAADSGRRAGRPPAQAGHAAGRHRPPAGRPGHPVPAPRSGRPAPAPQPGRPGHPASVPRPGRPGVPAPASRPGPPPQPAPVLQPSLLDLGTTPPTGAPGRGALVPVTQRSGVLVPVAQTPGVLAPVVRGSKVLVPVVQGSGLLVPVTPTPGVLVPRALKPGVLVPVIRRAGVLVPVVREPGVLVPVVQVPGVLVPVVPTSGALVLVLHGPGAVVPVMPASGVLLPAAQELGAQLPVAQEPGTPESPDAAQPAPWTAPGPVESPEPPHAAQPDRPRTAPPATASRPRRAMAEPDEPDPTEAALTGHAPARSLEDVAPAVPVLAAPVVESLEATEAPAAATSSAPARRALPEPPSTEETAPAEHDGYRPRRGVDEFVTQIPYRPRRAQGSSAGSQEEPPVGASAELGAESLVEPLTEPPARTSPVGLPARAAEPTDGRHWEA